jgi:hypothetical protein
MADMNKVDEARRMTVDQQGNWQYPSATATGHVEIVIPAAHGPNSEERLLVKDFGAHVAREVERSLAPNPYPVSSPRKSATATFRHYVGAAMGASLMDKEGLERMETLARDFEREPEQQEFFKQVIRPYLYSLKPGKR